MRDNGDYGNRVTRGRSAEPVSLRALEVPARGAARSRPVPNVFSEEGSRAGEEVIWWRARELAEWVPEDSRDATARLMVDGLRLAQEWIGTEALSSDLAVLEHMDL